MRRNRVYFLSLFFAALFILELPAQAETVSLPTEDARWIAGMIFKNECNLRTECLTTWNEGESFPSFGIGHFIWYPQGQTGPFRESFPELIQFLKKSGRAVPAWLEEMSREGLPWKSRAEFLAAQQEESMVGMRQFLESTMDIQALFMIRRFQDSLLQISKQALLENKAVLIEKMMALSRTRQGLYAMIDYTNFKGDGLSATEQYHAHGWGLYQVLNEMRWPTASAGTSEKEFVSAAQKVLRRRVDNAPSERLEERWIAGWLKRVETYDEHVSDFSSLDTLESPVIFSSELEPIELLNFAELSLH